jgi:hypothetical protein
MKESWRPCKNVSRVRLTVGLLCAPLPVAGLLAIVMGFGNMPRTFMVWFILAGIAYLGGSCFLRRSVGRLGCLIAGAVAGATWLYGQILLFAISPEFLANLLGFQGISHTPSELLAHYWAGPEGWSGPLIGSVVGCFTGWLLWRIGVRPAPEPLRRDIGAVFE